MGFYGKRWLIDGLTAGLIMRSAVNGHYSVVFEREYATLEQIEAVNWAKPNVEYIGPHGEEPGLPEGYGFDVVKITYDSNCRSYTVELQVSSQYLGDVTGYQAQVADLEKQVEDAKGQVTEAQTQAEEARAQVETAQAQAQEAQAQAAEATAQAETAQAQAEEAKTQAAEAQAKAEAAEADAAEKAETIATQAQEIEALKADSGSAVVESLEAAYQEGVESNG